VHCAVWILRAVPPLVQRMALGRAPGCGQIGNAARNSLRGPQFFQTDAALVKEIAFTDRVALQFRADAFNIFNKVNLGLPNSQVDAVAGVAGAITTTAPGAIQRQWQFSARLQF